MAAIGWIFSLIALLGGLTLLQDMPVDGSPALAIALFLLALLACPLLWRELPLGVTRGQRIIAALALVFALPIILTPAH